MAYVYRHIRLDKNEPFYIGIGSDNTYKRAKEFFLGRNKYWKNIKNKTEIEVEILIDNLTWEEACNKEKEFIALYGRNDLCKGSLVNMTDGGDGLFNPSKEIRDKISNANKGRKISKEASKKLSERMKGKVLSEETKLKISNANKGKKKPIEFGKNQTERQKGIVCWNFIKAAQLKNTGSTQSKETIEKRIKKLRGRKNNQEQIDKMRKSAIDMGKCRKVLCVTNNTVYSSVSEASRTLGVYNIGYVCQGKLKQTKGFVFKYFDELENRIKQLENALE